MAAKEKEYTEETSVWWQQLSEGVGDARWDSYSKTQKVALAKQRTEYKYFSEKPDKNIRFPHGTDVRGHAVARHEAAFRVRINQADSYAWCARMDELAHVGAEVMISFDWSKEPGERAGKEWMFTVTNEHGELMGMKGTETTQLSEVAGFLRTISQRPNVNVGAVCYDCVRAGKMSNELKVIFGADVCIQDRFHVSHNLSMW